MKKLVVIVLIALIITAIANPSEDSFKEHLKTEINNTKEEKGIFETAINEIFKIQGALTTEYSDYVFFSTAKADIADTTVQYIGILGFWIKM